MTTKKNNILDPKKAYDEAFQAEFQTYLDEARRIKATPMSKPTKWFIRILLLVCVIIGWNIGSALF